MNVDTGERWTEAMKGVDDVCKPDNDSCSTFVLLMSKLLANCSANLSASMCLGGSIFSMTETMTSRIVRFPANHWEIGDHSEIARVAGLFDPNSRISTKSLRNMPYILPQ